MHIKYHTGVTTLAQFVALTLLNLITTIASSVGSCVKSGSECVGDVTLNLLYFLVVAAWFGLLWVLGFAAQDRRSKRIAQVLILAEVAVLLAALLDARHFPSILGLLTSLLDAFLAGWTILLAWRLIRSHGGRMVATTKPRTRRTKAKASQ